MYALKPPAGGRKGRVGQYLLPATDTARDLYCSHTLARRPMAAGGGGEGGAKPAAHPLFADERVPTFFRRPAWSPDGAAGRGGPPGVTRLGRRGAQAAWGQQKAARLAGGWQAAVATHSPARPPIHPRTPAGSLLVVPAGLYKASAEGRELNTAHVYARGRWGSPIMHLPGHPKV